MDGESNEIPLEEHLKELRRRFKVILYSLLIATVTMMAFPSPDTLLAIVSGEKMGELIAGTYKPLVGWILDGIRAQALPPAFRIYGQSPTEPLQVFFLSSFMIGLILTMPLIGYEVYKFVDPALYPHEKKMVYPFLTSFSLLFAVGALFGYFVLVRLVFWAMVPFFEITKAEKLISLMSFYMLVFNTVLASGIAFTVPAIIVLLVRFKLINTSSIAKNRLYIYGILFIIVAFITPDGSMLTNFVLFFPIVGLIEGSLIIARKYEKEAEKELIRLGIEDKVCSFCGSRDVKGYFCQSCGRCTV